MSDEVRLEFQGHSDDTFGEYNHFGDDYDCCASGEPIVFLLQAEGEGMHVIGQYGADNWPNEMPGCWMIGVQQLDEDRPLPWPLRFEMADNGYSPKLVIDAPASVKMRCLNRD